jgi:hypothetical protein
MLADPVQAFARVALAQIVGAAVGNRHGDQLSRLEIEAAFADLPDDLVQRNRAGGAVAVDGAQHQQHRPRLAAVDNETLDKVFRAAHARKKLPSAPCSNLRRKH